MYITTNIFNRDGIKRIVALVPIAIKGKNLFIKRRIISESKFDFIILKVSNHLLADITELIKNSSAGAHRGDI